MRRTEWMLSLSIACLGLALGAATLVADKDNPTPKLKTKEVMGKYLKGKDAPLANAINGKSSAAELKELHAAFKALAANKPPRGDDEAWAKKTAALLAATEALLEKKEGAEALLKAAANCKACHDDHKGK